MSKVETSPRGTCSNSECPLPSGGACLRGHPDPIDCELYQIEGTDLDGEPYPEAAVPTIRIRSAEAMSIREASGVLGRSPTTIVVPLGHIEVGKTTLLSVVYEQAAADRLRDWSLGESRTLLGFERRCHDASVRSQRLEAVTARTQRDPDDVFLHLVLRHRTTHQRWPILLADVSGEDVETLVRSGPPERLLTILHRADDIMILIDGAALADSASRENEVRVGLDLVRILGTQRFSVPPRFTLVVTKYDVLAGGTAEAPGSERVLEAAGTMFGEVNEARVAARPASGSPLAQGYGVDDLLDMLQSSREQPVASTWPLLPPEGELGPLLGLWGSDQIG